MTSKCLQSQSAFAPGRGCFFSMSMAMVILENPHTLTDLNIKSIFYVLALIVQYFTVAQFDLYIILYIPIQL